MRVNVFVDTFLILEVVFDVLLVLLIMVTATELRLTIVLLQGLGAGRRDLNTRLARLPTAVLAPQRAHHHLNTIEVKVLINFQHLDETLTTVTDANAVLRAVQLELHDLDVLCFILMFPV